MGLIASASCSYAVEIMSGQSVNVGKDQKADDDILAAANDVTISPAVQGDVVAAGNTVAVSGSVKDSAMLAGNNVVLSGPVGNDSWLAGQVVVVSSSVKDNAFLAGNSVGLPRDGSVGKDLLAAGATVNVMGKVGRHLRAAAGALTIAGSVGGNVYAQADKVTVLKGSVINGNLYYESANKAVIEPGAKIVGKTLQTIPAKEKAKPLFWGPFYGLLCLIASIIFGAVMLLVFPVRSQGTSDTIRNSPWASIGIGLAALIGVPIVVVILMITIVGIPVALAATAVYLVLLYAAHILAALAIGQWILGRGGVRIPKPLGSMVLGLLILTVLGLVPVLGPLVRFIAMLAGLGGFLISWWQSRGPSLVPSVPQAQQAPPPAAEGPATAA